MPIRSGPVTDRLEMNRRARHEVRSPHLPVKKPNREERQRMCTGKRRYRSQGDALDAAAIAGVERKRSAYLCPLCRQWHLTSS